MQTVKLIAAPIETVWEILIDTQQWPIWGPSLCLVECPQRYIVHGTTGRIKTAFGFWVPFEITCFEPPVFWHWKVAGIRATGHRLKQLSPKRCKLIFEMPLVAFPYAAICHQAAGNIARLAENYVNS